jgi:hypothetical protein
MLESFSIAFAAHKGMFRSIGTCMHACMCVTCGLYVMHVGVRMRLHMLVCACMCVTCGLYVMHVGVRMLAYACMRMHVCLYVSMYVCVHAYMYDLKIFLCIYVNLHYKYL